MFQYYPRGSVPVQQERVLIIIPAHKAFSHLFTQFLFPVLLRVQALLKLSKFVAEARVPSSAELDHSVVLAEEELSEIEGEYFTLQAIAILEDLYDFLEVLNYVKLIFFVSSS